MKANLLLEHVLLDVNATQLLLPNGVENGPQPLQLRLVSLQGLLQVGAVARYVLQFSVRRLLARLRGSLSYNLSNGIINIASTRAESECHTSLWRLVNCSFSCINCEARSFSWPSKLRQWFEKGPSPSMAFVLSATCCRLEDGGCPCNCCCCCCLPSYNFSGAL